MSTNYDIHSVSFVNYSDVIDHIGFDEDVVEAIGDYGFPTFFTGDATIPLYDKQIILDCIINGYIAYLDELDDNLGEPSRNIPERVYSPAELTQLFNEVVGQEDYINMGK